MEFLPVSLIIELHINLIDQFGGLHGLRDKKLLESAITYPQLLHDIGMEGDIHILAAAYFYHLINNHPFLDGNKRIGTLAMLTFLKINGEVLHFKKNKLYDLAIKTAQSKINEKDIAILLKQLANN